MSSSLVAMEPFTQGLDEARDVLSRPPGSDVTDLQRARLALCYQKMMFAAAQPGELWRIMTGQLDDELGLVAQNRAGQASKVGRPRLSRAHCRDCRAQLTDQSRSGADPVRCSSCARVKRSQYNQTYRQQAAAG